MGASGELIPDKHPQEEKKMDRAQFLAPAPVVRFRRDTSVVLAQSRLVPAGGAAVARVRALKPKLKRQARCVPEVRRRPGGFKTQGFLRPSLQNSGFLKTLQLTKKYRFCRLRILDSFRKNRV